MRPNSTTNRNLNQVKEERRSRTYTFRLTHSISLTRHSLSPQLSAFGRGTTTRSCMGAPPPPNNDTRADGYSNNERLKPPRTDRCCKLNDPNGMPRDIHRYGCTSIVAEEDMLHTHAKEALGPFDQGSTNCRKKNCYVEILMNFNNCRNLKLHL